MKKNFPLILMMVLSAIIFSACQRFSNQPTVNEGPALETPVDSEMKVIDTSGIEVGQPIPQEVPVTGVQPEVQSNNYRLYDPLAVEEVAKEGTAVLFFHANWCPTCKVLNEELGQRYSELPKGVVIFKVDYDVFTNLKTEYEITYQHTFVILDENLAATKKWNGGDFDEILKNLQ